MMPVNEWVEERKSKDLDYIKNYIIKADRMADYYKRQRIMGFMILIIGIASSCIGYYNIWDHLVMLGIAISLVGLSCILTKRMVYIDRYYFECQDKMRELL